MKKFWTKYEHETPEAWLVKAIHENNDFSLSVKNIPKADFVQYFRRKYEVEFLRHETIDPLSIEIYVDDLNINPASSAHSSVYSQNLGRSISMASVASASSKQESIVQEIINENKNNDTAMCTGVHNSQITVDNKEVNVFDRNKHHINLIDNTLVQKLPRVEYEVEYGLFTYPGYVQAN
jgi:hypothetical protein